MKQKSRLFALLLAVCLLALSLTSCGLLPPRQNPVTSPTQEQTTPTLGMAYTLTQEELDGFYKLLQECEELFSRIQVSKARLERMLSQVEQQYTHIVTQAQLAYIYYCVDREAENAEEDYLFSSSAQADAYEAYMQMCKRLDTSDSPNRDFFFRDWSEESLESMRGYSGELNELYKSNDELLVAYRALDAEHFMNGAAEYYHAMLRNNNRIAALNGYANYWEYAYAEVYNRDFGAEELATIRTYVKQYLLPLFHTVRTSFQELNQRLSAEDQAFVENLMTLNYNEVASDLINNYLKTFPGSSEYTLRNMLEPRNSFFANASTSHQGAFTAFLYEPMRPVCYFGPGYQKTFTVIHEMGHYYAYTVRQTPDIPIDLAEVHSQGNEWLFLSSLNRSLSPELAQAVFLYQLYSALTAIVTSVIIDDFEQRCYTQIPETAEDLNAVMAAVMAEYGGEEWLNAFVGNPDAYWRVVVLEHPVYYISYAVSMLAALQIYCIAEESSFDAAQRVYLNLVRGTGSSEEYGFFAELKAAGLTGPTDEAVYRTICGLAGAKGVADVSE